MKHVTYLMIFPLNLIVLADCGVDSDPQELLEQSKTIYEKAQPEDLPFDSLYMKMVNHSGPGIEQANWTEVDGDTVKTKLELIFDDAKIYSIKDGETVTTYNEGDYSI